MADEEAGRPTSFAPLVLALLVVLASALFGFFFLRPTSSKSSKNSSDHDSQAEAASAPAGGGAKGLKGKKHVGAKQGHDKAGAGAGQQGHHPLDLNTLKGHSDRVTGMAFSADGRALATACEDGAVRVFKLEDVMAKSFKFLRLNLPLGTSARGVAFGEGSGQLLVSALDTKGGCLLCFGPASGKEAEEARRQGKLSPPEVKWEKRLAHDGKEILTIVSAAASYGSGDGSAIAATCSSDGTDVRIWSVKDGKSLGKVDSNQLQNTMAALSPDGRFLAIAAFTSDVKVWELVYGKDGGVEEVAKAMQLKGHKSAVTWLCFTSDSKQMVTTSKDGTIKKWNLDVRYHLSEDPKCLLTLPVPPSPASVPAKGHILERIALSPDNTVLAAAFGSNIQWIDMGTGAVMATAEGAHEGNILWMTWSPTPHRTDQGLKAVLATCGADKKVKLWLEPPNLPA